MSKLEELERRYLALVNFSRGMGNKVHEHEKLSGDMLAALRESESRSADLRNFVTMNRLERQDTHYENLRESAELKDDNARLRTAIEQAPHNMGCASLQGGPDTKGWGSLDRCDCWKRQALAQEDKP